MSLPSDQVCIYNGIDFGPMCETIDFKSVPIPDSAGRTVTYRSYTITVKGIVSYDMGSVPAEELLPGIRLALLQYGGAFTYQNKGLGGINIQTTQADVRYGPKPQSLSLKQTGAYTVEVTWSVQVHIAECTQNLGAPQGLQGILEFCYGLQYGVDGSGYTRRTYDGHVRVAGVRKNIANRTLSDSADRLREQIAPNVAFGFKRTNQDFSLSEDKCELRFTINDEEMPPNIPPPGIVMVDASHRLETRETSFRMWFGTITASYEVRKDLTGVDAMKYFLQLCNARIKPTVAASQKPSADGLLVSTVIPMRFSLEEPELYGRRTANFSMTYRFSLPIATVLQGAGSLWTALPNSNYNQWATSMVNVWAPRGFAGMAFNLNEDLIIDICTPQKPTLKAVAGGTSVLRTLPGSITFSIQTPPPANSWLDYQIRAVMTSVPAVSELRALPGKPPTFNLDAPPFNANQGVAKIFQADKPSIFQVRTKPHEELVLSGYAVRAGYDIPCPVASSIGDVPLVPYNQDGDFYISSVVGNAGGVPIVVARWQQRYLIPQIPSQPVGSMPDPAQGGPTLKAQSAAKIG